MPTYEQLRILFPNASPGFLAANSSDGVPAHLVQKPAPAHQEAKGKRTKRNPNLSLAEATANFERLEANYLSSLALVERDLRNGPLAKGQTETGDPRKFLVRVTSFRVRLLDEDNLCEKYHVDLCRYAGLLRGDDPSQTHIVTTQEKVRTKKEERTEIVIEPMPSLCPSQLP
jgi:hypothetical protein